MTAKYDVKRALPGCYAPRNADWQLVEVPDLRYLAVDGSGDPNTSTEYAQAVEALYAVAYTVKFASRRGLDRDFVVGPLEGLWWADDLTHFLTRRKDTWQWRLMVHLPDWVADDMVDTATHTVHAKKRLPTARAVRPETLREATCAQKLHTGSYDDETATLTTLHRDYLPAHQLRESGHHHEIYLSDPRRTPAERLRTILRQPVAPA